jgi:predicted transcriptional regulator
MITKLEKEANMLNRHLEILRLVIDSEPIGIVTMSNKTGYPHHKVRYSLRILEEENLIDPSSQGAVTTEQTNEFVEKLDTRLDEIERKLTEMKIEKPVDSET